MNKTLKTILIVLVSLLVGGFGGFSLGVGTGAGVGIATGLVSGVCLTVEGAKDAGLMTDEQIPDILQAGVTKIVDIADVPKDELPTGDNVDCAKFLEDLKAAGEKS